MRAMAKSWVMARVWRAVIVVATLGCAATGCTTNGAANGAANGATTGAAAGAAGGVASGVVGVEKREAAQVVLRAPNREDWVVTVELARTEAERSRGLMFREKLAPDAGMLFVWGEEAPRSFWMMNTYIALDMIFIGADGVVVGVVENAEPMTTEGRGVEGASQYVLEVVGGAARAHGVGAGTQVYFRNITGLAADAPVLR